MDALLLDVRYALRALSRNAGFAIVVVLTLAIGVGANIAVFSVIESVLLRPLPFEHADRLVAVWTTTPRGGPRMGTSGPAFADFKAQSRSFDYVAQVVPRFTYTWTGHGEPRTVICTGISADFFPMLGVHPVLGRLYAPEEYHVDGVQVVISQRFWREQLGGDPQIIGRVLMLDGTAQTVDRDRRDAAAARSFPGHRRLGQSRSRFFMDAGEEQPVPHRHRPSEIWRHARAGGAGADRDPASRR
jgi:hypothetical protein